MPTVGRDRWKQVLSYSPFIDLLSQAPNQWTIPSASKTNINKHNFNLIFVCTQHSFFIWSSPHLRSVWGHPTCIFMAVLCVAVIFNNKKTYIGMERWLNLKRFFHTNIRAWDQAPAPIKSPGMMVYACNSSAEKAETGEFLAKSLSSRLSGETLPQK